MDFPAIKETPCRPPCRPSLLDPLDPLVRPFVPGSKRWISHRMVWWVRRSSYNSVKIPPSKAIWPPWIRGYTLAVRWLRVNISMQYGVQGGWLIWCLSDLQRNVQGEIFTAPKREEAQSLGPWAIRVVLQSFLATGHWLSGQLTNENDWMMMQSFSGHFSHSAIIQSLIQSFVQSFLIKRLAVLQKITKPYSQSSGTKAPGIWPFYLFSMVVGILVPTT